MSRARNLMKVRSMLAAFAGLAVAATTALAQPEGSGRGFLFGAPSGSLTIRTGYSGATAGSDIFSFVTNELTLRKGDFASLGVGADLSFAISPRFDVMLSVDYDGMEKQSEFREWIDNDGRPIEQKTAFGRQSYLISAKYYIMPYGRTLGRLAWVPLKFAPWVSAGVGKMAYTFSQNGDFIDYERNNKVFYDSFKSSRWGTSGQLSAGLDVALNQRFVMQTQARYLMGKASLENDFSGFDPIDLSGVGVMAGLTIRF